MNVLFAVIDDLYTFARGMVFGWRTDPEMRASQLSLPPSRVMRTHTGHTLPAVPYVDSDAKDVLVRPSTLPQKNTVVYSALPHVSLRTEPDEADDTVIGMLSYGDMMMVLKAEEDWSYVAVGEKQGYVETKALAHKTAEVYPDFTVGETNGPREANTVRLRFIIKDEFSAGVSSVPLQMHEYVYYKIFKRGMHITWPDVRPRTAGSWTRILEECENVSIEDTPSVGAVMEYLDTDESARLGYVEKTFPDGSIKISEVDYPDRGIYNERILVKNEWTMLSPSFLTVS